MVYAKLVRLDTNIYSLIEHKDEKLFVLATVLLDHIIRSTLRSRLQSFPEISLGQEFHFAINPDYKITIRRANEEQLVIALFKNHESRDEADNPLIIDIYINILSDLIDDIDDLLEQEAQEFYIIMQGNTIRASKALPVSERIT